MPILDIYAITHEVVVWETVACGHNGEIASNVHIQRILARTDRCHCECAIVSTLAKQSRFISSPFLKGEPERDFADRADGEIASSVHPRSGRRKDRQEG